MSREWAYRRHVQTSRDANMNSPAWLALQLDRARNGRRMFVAFLWRTYTASWVFVAFSHRLPQSQYREVTRLAAGAENPQGPSGEPTGPQRRIPPSPPFLPWI